MPVNHLILGGLGMCLISGDMRAEESAIWDLKELNGVSYVTMDSLQRYYKFDRMARDGANVELENRKVELKAEIGSTDCMLNNIRFILANPVIEDADTVYLSRTDLTGLIDPVLRPNFIKNAVRFNTVILDPAFGGEQRGAVNTIGSEADYALKIANLVKPLLGDKGYTVVMTRNGDDEVTIDERVAIANSVAEPAIFISIQFGSGPEESRGIHMETMSPLTGGSEQDFSAASVSLATSIHSSLMRRLGKNTVDGGIKRPEAAAYPGLKHPAIRLEAGYMTHPYEARLIDHPHYQSAIADGIVDGAAKYNFAVSQKPAHQGGAVSEPPMRIEDQ